MLKISNLRKQFAGKIALDIPEMSIEKGTLLGLVGNNGAGKTTFFRLLLDLLKADSGNVLFYGEDVSRTETWKQRTASFIDNRFLIEFLTPEEYFSFVGETYKLDKETVDGRLRSFSQFMNNEILGQKKYIRNFSAGNKQKIGIMAAMMVRPELLILDEPFNFLDPSSQIEIRDMIRQLNEDTGATILISSHNLNYTTDISTRLVLLERGYVQKDCTRSPETIEELNRYFVEQANSQTND
ncbi:MAG: ABC transporter ATP-binding protein [Bacteroidales bacterium]|jgi:ABC-2 type transport system ATP-binding protein|nr:ABC transporter ATP-binding protein [Bacteroidales bacterium]